MVLRLFLKIDSAIYNLFLQSIKILKSGNKLLSKGSIQKTTVNNNDKIDRQHQRPFIFSFFHRNEKK